MIMRDRIELTPAPDGTVESPGVGRYFYESSCSAEETLIGCLERLGRRYALVISGRCMFVPDLLDGAACEYGDRIGHIIEAAECGHQPEAHAQKVAHYPAPTDGFVTILDSRGEPFKRPGDTLAPGDIVAVIELMKVRIDVLYDGPDKAVFVSYECTDRRGIKRGASLFSYKSV